LDAGGWRCFNPAPLLTQISAAIINPPSTRGPPSPPRLPSKTFVCVCVCMVFIYHSTQYLSHPTFPSPTSGGLSSPMYSTANLGYGRISVCREPAF
jgi:hypothetical protein